MIRPVAVLLLLFLATPAFSASPVKITADSFVVEEAKSDATFSGNVLVTRDGIEVRSDNVVVHYGPGGVNDIQSFVATGNVRIKTEGQTAVGSRAVFDPKTEILTMTGGVEVSNASGKLSGPQLTVDLRTNKTTFKASGNSRVTGTFTPQ